MSESAATRESFGGFTVGSLLLALPMSALREVVYLSDLIDLPCPAPCVIGGIDVRGMVIPVVDLRIVLGRAAPAGEARNVVIIAHEKKIMGLLADGVTGIFGAVEGSYKRVSVDDATAAVFLASVQRSDTHAMVNVLSAEALARLHQVPMVDDPEPSRPELLAAADKNADADAAVPMLLFQCNGIPLAVEAIVVHATLSKPDIEISELTSGHCLRVINYAGFKVPAVDLLTLCGLGALSNGRDYAAFVVSLPAGYVAFLISAVIDVVKTRADDVKTLPAFAMPCPGLFAGALPVCALPAESAGRSGDGVNQYLVIDAAGLQACADVLSMSELNIAVGDGAIGPNISSDRGLATLGRRSMITYMLETERASPLEQVVEILNYQPGTEIFGSRSPMLGLMIDRGRSIPVLCLGQMAGEHSGAPTAASRILVVESDGELIGFAVRKLNSIEEADWQPVVPTIAVTDENRKAFRHQPHKLALFGSRSTDRMLPVLDLQELAASLRPG